MSTLTATPAYGRDYKSRKELLSDWHAGKDFQVGTYGPYFSVRDVPGLQAQGIRWVNVRFKSLSEVAVIRIGS